MTEPNSDVHMVKIPKGEYDTLMSAKLELSRLGYQRLPQQVIQNAKIEGYLNGRNEGFTQGAVVAIGLAALLYLLSREQ